MIYLIWGLRCLSIGLFGGIFISLSAYHDYRRREGALQIAQIATVADLKQMSTQIATAVGAGIWREYVQLWGNVRVRHPLHSKLKKVPCVYCQYQVTRKYRKIRRKTGTSSIESSETATQGVISEPFDLEDETGRIRVNLDGAQVRAISILKEHRQEQHYTNPSHDAVRHFGSISHHLRPTYDQGITTGFTYQESILPPDQPILVVGEVKDQGGTLQLSAPTNPDQPYYVHLRPHKNALSESKRDAKSAIYCMIGCTITSPLVMALSFWLTQ